ncbi:Transposase [Psychrobacter phenylpyruvicus]|uniref:Transposase n=1 Tax=Psychrobacter phenylpyruvicus TaxID=29432 RepID=A0A379LRQ2_9GAMM|nr:Transposase [Psychrobacter phenylpyruvicus]
MTKKVKRYSEEFKAEAVKAIENNGGNISATARQLGLPMQTLANWQRKANQGKLKGTKQYDPELVSALEEIKRLKRELKIAQEEREILKRPRRTLRRTVSKVRLY